MADHLRPAGTRGLIGAEQGRGVDLERAGGIVGDIRGGLRRINAIWAAEQQATDLLRRPCRRLRQQSRQKRRRDDSLLQLC